MAHPRIAELVNAIRESFTSMPARVPGRGLGMGWPRPPLLTNASLRGVPLSKYASVSVDIDAPTLRGLFEEYAEQYLKPNPPEGAGDFLATRLELHKRIADWLFPRQAGPLHHLSVFLWIISNSFEDMIIDAGPGMCLISAGDLRFGVSDNKVVSKFTSNELEPFDYHNALAMHHTIGGPRVSERSSLSILYRHTATIKNDEQRDLVKLALSYLFYRYDHLGRLTLYLYNGCSPRNANGYNKRGTAKEAARILMQHPNPMPRVYEMLVMRGVMDPDEFQDLFGEDSKISDESEDFLVEPGLLMKWHRILMKVSNGK